MWRPLLLSPGCLDALAALFKCCIVNCVAWRVRSGPRPHRCWWRGPMPNLFPHDRVCVWQCAHRSTESTPPWKRVAALHLTWGPTVLSYIRDRSVASCFARTYSFRQALLVQCYGPSALARTHSNTDNLFLHSKLRLCSSRHLSTELKMPLSTARASDARPTQLAPLSPCFDLISKSSHSTSTHVH
jgi:hypothetical protein